MGASASQCCQTCEACGATSLFDFVTELNAEPGEEVFFHDGKFTQQRAKASTGTSRKDSQRLPAHLPPQGPEEPQQPVASTALQLPQKGLQDVQAPPLASSSPPWPRKGSEEAQLPPLANAAAQASRKGLEERWYAQQQLVGAGATPYRKRSEELPRLAEAAGRPPRKASEEVRPLSPPEAATPPPCPASEETLQPPADAAVRLARKALLIARKGSEELQAVPPSRKPSEEELHKPATQVVPPLSRKASEEVPQPLARVVQSLPEDSRPQGLQKAVAELAAHLPAVDSEDCLSEDSQQAVAEVAVHSPAAGSEDAQALPQVEGSRAEFQAAEDALSPRKAASVLGLPAEDQLDTSTTAGETLDQRPVMVDSSHGASCESLCLTPDGPSPEVPLVEAHVTEPEPYSDFLARAASCISDAGIAGEAAPLFEAFQSTDDLGLTFATFARLCFLAAKPGEEDVPPWATKRSCRYPYQMLRTLCNHWKARKLWKLLDERSSRPEYTEAPCCRGRLEGRSCLVIGAGPCGLRVAIELRLLGAQVVVVEQRVNFTRINQLHIWSWCGEDLKGLGAKVIEPPPNDFGSNPDLLVIAINDLQKLLLKVALLLGVEVRMGMAYDSMHCEAGSWQTTLRPPVSPAGTEGRAGPSQAAPSSSLFNNSGTLPPSPFSPGVLRDVAVLVGAGGFASDVGEHVGMRMVETESLRKESAIGLICNVARTGGRAEADLRSFSMARQFYTALFKQAAQETGADLENVVYVKAPTAHYFVMTPTPKSLVATGVVKSEAQRPLLALENIDREKLDELVQRILAFSFKKGEPSVLEAVRQDLGRPDGFPGYADAGPRLFDFSKMRRSSEGLVFLTPSGTVACSDSEGNSLLVALAGDALIEPFWPEGLGIMRGFFGVLDVCYAVQQWSNGATEAATQEIYQDAFQQLKTLSAATRARVLREDEKKFALAPTSRYR